MPIKNRLRLWGRRLALIGIILAGYSLLYRAAATCVDEAGLPRTCTEGDALRAIPQILMDLSGLILYVFFLFFIIVIQLVGMFWFLGRGHAYVIRPGEYDTNFDDVRGQPQVVESVKEVVKLFRGFREFRKLGGYPPHGILFEGPREPVRP